MGIEGVSKQTQKDENGPFSRRGFLRGAIGFSVAAQGAYLASNASSNERTISREEATDIHERMKNVSNIETSNANYKIAYSIHDIENNPEIVDGVNAIVLETNNIATKNDVWESVVLETREVPKSSRMPTQYGRILKKAIEQRIPVYFLDLVDTSKISSPITSLPEIQQAVATKRIEAVSGGALAGLGVANLSTSEKISRRKLVSSTAALFAGAYLNSSSLDAPSTISDGKEVEPDVQTSRFSIGRVAQDVNTSLHPELRTHVLETRNTLIAEKTEQVAHELAATNGEKPTIAVFIGAAHTGIEKELKSDPAHRVPRLRAAFGSELPIEGIIIKVQAQERELDRSISVNGQLEADEFFWLNHIIKVTQEQVVFGD